jgi:type I restriction enzyme M protein
MQWAFETYGVKVYSDLKSIEKDILDWCEENDIDLNAKKRKALVSPKTWQKQKEVLDTATHLINAIGSEEYTNFNAFQEIVEKALRQAQGSSLSASEKNLIYAAVSWYDETADKVIKKTQKFKEDKLNELLEHLGCAKEQLPDYGFYPTGKTNEYIIYESESDLRDYENVPLKGNIYEYFLQEVKPHVKEAWIDLDKTKIGYEISFNKYFYKHKPLRSIDEVSAEILELEKENEGLIMDILKLN